MPAIRPVVVVLLRGWETFLYTLKAGPAGGRLRRPSSAGSTPRQNQAAPDGSLRKLEPAHHRGD
jgi:hypothetical protein